MGCIFPLIALFLLAPLLLALFYFQVVTFSFTKLGVSPEGAFLLMLAVLLGSMVNIPVWRQRTQVYYYDEQPYLPFFYYHPPACRERVIAVNIGGAVIPTLFGLYLFGRAPFIPTVLATLIVALVARSLARPVPGVGITMPAFIPPIVAALAALLLAPHNAAPVAFIAGTWGTLIGADLLNLPRFHSLGANVLSIGGAGVFDGIFLVGIVAALLA